MMNVSKSRITLKHAVSMAFLVLVIYYPITVYVNVQFDLSAPNLALLAIPTLLAFVVNIAYIMGMDRAIDLCRSLMGDRFPLDSHISMVLLSIPLAMIGIVIDRVTFHLAVFLVVKALDYIQISGVSLEPQTGVVARANDAITLITTLSITYLLINRKVNMEMKRLEIESQKLINENTLAQFEALKNQVSPHFLFNSLSILSSLVHVDPDLSEKFIDRLSRAFRYILEQKGNDVVTLSTELGFISSYAFLLNIRFDNRFKVDVSIDEARADEIYIAPHALQLLVENAVKHNRMTSKEPLHVSIAIEGRHIVVSNPIRRRDDNEVVASMGIGLSNIVNRYRLLTSDTVEIETADNIFKVKIPVIV